MSGRQAFTLQALAFVAAAAMLTVVIEPQSSLGQAKKDKKPDPKKGFNTHFKHLQARFTAWDTSKDGVLDTAELAKAFRGGDAKPFDKIKVETPPPASGPETSVTIERGKSTRTSVAVAVLLHNVCPCNFCLGELMTWKITKKTTAVKPPLPVAVPDYRQFADYQFYNLAGGKGNKVSRQAFDSWAKGYAKMLDHYDQTMKSLQASQNNFAKAKTPQAKQKAALDVQKHQLEVQQALAQVNTVPGLIQAALKLQK